MYKVKEDVIFEKEIKKTEQSKIVFKVLKNGNGCQVDIREYVDTDNYSGPTKKGVRFFAGDDNWNQFFDILSEANKVLMEEL